MALDEPLQVISSLLQIASEPRRLRGGVLDDNAERVARTECFHSQPAAHGLCPLHRFTDDFDPFSLGKV